MRIRWIEAVSLACALALTAGCAERRASSAGAQDARVAVINSVCPIAGDDFGERTAPRTLTRTWKGQTIGFCCRGCLPGFDRLDDAGKDGVLMLAKANKPGAEPCPDEPAKP